MVNPDYELENNLNHYSITHLRSQTKIPVFHIPLYRTCYIINCCYALSDQRHLKMNFGQDIFSIGNRCNEQK